MAATWRVTGTLNKGSSNFEIDHPLDPANKLLHHSGSKSDEMKNLYDGVAQLDSDGRAEVVLPDWFEALNENFRYQLTPIGASAPDLHIADELHDGRFSHRRWETRLRRCAGRSAGYATTPTPKAHPLRVDVEEVYMTRRGCFCTPKRTTHPPSAHWPHSVTKPAELSDSHVLRIQVVAVLGTEIIITVPPP